MVMQINVHLLNVAHFFPPGVRFLSLMPAVNHLQSRNICEQASEYPSMILHGSQCWLRTSAIQSSYIKMSDFESVRAVTILQLTRLMSQYIRYIFAVSLRFVDR